MNDDGCRCWWRRQCDQEDDEYGDDNDDDFNKTSDQQFTLIEILSNWNWKVLCRDVLFISMQSLFLFRRF